MIYYPHTSGIVVALSGFFAGTENLLHTLLQLRNGAF